MEQLPNGDNRLIVPKQAPDSINTVLVFDYKGQRFPDSLHYITRNTMKERFLAFDAIQHGKGFSFGDGKTNRYYLDGWKKKDQSVSWQFRTESQSPLRFKMVIKYLATQETSGGSYAVIVDRNDAASSDELYNSKHGVSTDAKNVITQDLGDISLENGSYTLKLVPVTINKEELMKLLEVQLIPLDK